MKKRKNTPRKLKRSLKIVSAVRREIEQLRDWAKRHVEVEFTVDLAGSLIRYSVRIVETTFDDGILPTFDFFSQSGMHAILMPQRFPKSSLQNVEGMHNGVYVEGKTKNSEGFSIVEPIFLNKPSANLASVVDKLHTWERLQLDLHVLLSQSFHAVSFLGQVRELSSGLFSFANVSASAQLMIRIEDYKHMKLKFDGDKSSITLIDPRTQEMCVISDAATKPETLFNRFIDISSTIH